MTGNYMGRVSGFANSYNRMTARAKGVFIIVCVAIIVAIGIFVSKILSSSDVVMINNGQGIEYITNSEGKTRALGFALVLTRTIIDYQPISVTVEVKDAKLESKIVRFRLTEGGVGAKFAAEGPELILERFDDETGELFFRLTGSSSSSVLVLSLEADGLKQSSFGDYSVSLADFSVPMENAKARGHFTILEGHDVVYEGWVAEGFPFSFDGNEIGLVGWGNASDGSPILDVQIRRNVRAPLVASIGLVAFLLVIYLFSELSGDTRHLMVSGGTKIAARRALLFPFAGILLALLSLEAGARLIEAVRDYYFVDKNPFVSYSSPAPIFEVADQGGEKIFRRTMHNRLIVGDQQFKREKSKNGFRVFILGSSAAGGWPYDIGKYNMGKFFKYKLEELFPERDIEVLNVSGGTFGSHRVMAVLDEIIKYNPDLLIIYCGNNEFLEKYVYTLPKPPRPLGHVALIRLVYDAYNTINNSKTQVDIQDYTIEDQVSNRIAFAFGKASKNTGSSEEVQNVVNRYRANIDSMLRTAERGKIPVLLLNVPVNMKDWIPNASRHDDRLSPQKLAQWQEAFTLGVISLENRKPDEAENALREAVSIDGEHAESWYYLGVASLRLGKREAARKCFGEALEKDAYPFRMLPRMQTIIRELAEKHRVTLVDSVSALEARAGDGIIGLDVLMDYVHPDLASQETIALEMIRAMNASGLFPERPAVSPDSLRLTGPYPFQPNVDSGAVEGLYVQYLVMRQYDKLDAIYERYNEVMQRARKEDPSLEKFCSDGLKIMSEIHPIVKNYAKLVRSQKLGQENKEFTKEQAKEIYSQYLELIKRYEAPNMSREAFLKQVPDVN